MAALTPTTRFSSSTSSLSKSFTTRHCVNKSTLVRASKPQIDSDNAFISKEDVSYLAKVGAGSVAGAAAIKYGSIIFPEITQPNIAQALAMISVPVIVSVLLLIKQSSSK